MADIELYHYTPSFVAAAAFMGIFLASAALHFFQIWRLRAWYFVAMAIGANMESIGYAARMMSNKKPDSTMYYATQTLFILLAPSLFAASIYVVLGRLIVVLHAEDLSVIRVRWLTKFFVFGDVISFLAQSGGGGMSTKVDTAELGKTVIMVGLGVQLVFFGFFVLVTAIFHIRMRRRRSVNQQGWQRLLYALYFSSALILIRSVFRLIEYAGGRDGYFMQKEIWIYAFDATLMAQVSILFNVYHPVKVLQSLETKSEETISLQQSRVYPYAMA